MQDEYLMNVETGELVPAMEAIADFYKTHGYLDAWTDLYIETGMPVENSFIPAPDFSGAVRI